MVLACYIPESSFSGVISSRLYKLMMILILEFLLQIFPTWMFKSDGASYLSFNHHHFPSEPRTFHSTISLKLSTPCLNQYPQAWNLTFEVGKKHFQVIMILIMCLKLIKFIKSHWLILQVSSLLQSHTSIHT